MPSDVRADDREHVALLVVVVVDDDVAGQVHHATITAKLATAASIAGTTPGRRGSPQRRGGARRRLHGVARRDRSAIVFGSGRTHEHERERDDARAAGARATAPRARPASSSLAGEERPEDGGPEDRAEDGAEEHERDPARAPLRRVHVAGRGAREQHDAARGAEQREAEHHERREPTARRARRERRSRGCRQRSPRDHRHPAEAVHRAAGRQRGQPGRTRKIAGPSPSSPSIPRDEDEGDRLPPQRRAGTAERQISRARASEQVPAYARRRSRSHATSPSPEGPVRPRAKGGGRTGRRAPPRRRARPRAPGARARGAATNGRPARDLGARSAAGSRRSPGRCGCVGTTFQSSTFSSRPSSARTRWTIVARRLRRPGAGQLALGGERDPRDARAAVARRLADEQDRRAPPRASR